MRLGLSNQLDPFYVPHLIAYHRKANNATIVPDYLKVLKSSIDVSVMIKFCLAIYCIFKQDELSSQRDLGFESITETVIDFRASNGVFNSESQVSQVQKILLIATNS